MSGIDPHSKLAVFDGNGAAAHVAYNCSEVIAIYPITPSSNMGEYSDAWAADGEKNIFGVVPSVVEMQSEGGAAGAIHGALTTGALSTTFTASQGLLLMIPNMYKIAGELTSTVFHVSARALAAQALSIFGDHSDVMSTRQTGWAMLASGSVQEVMDIAMIAHIATLETRLPFLHFFDGFRTSHEEQKIAPLTQDDIRALLPMDRILEHRARGLNPEKPQLRGTAQNPDVYFQGRESANQFYLDAPAKVQKAMDAFAKHTGRSYKIFDYVGHPQAERVAIMMGSGAEVMHETIDALVAKGEKVGLVKVRLYRPFAAEAFLAAIPASCKSIAVMDRTKEPGSAGEPMYQDVQTALFEAVNAGKRQGLPMVVGGRYGLGSKEFTPAQCKAVLDNLSQAKPKNHFVVGITEDVTHSSLKVDASFTTETDAVKRAMFYALGSDGTIGANKNTIKIIGKATDFNAQGYFVYDSKKAGSMTVSHVRFSKQQIRSSYLISQADFVGCHAFPFLFQFDMVPSLKTGGTFLLNASYSAEEIWDKLPRRVQDQLIQKKAKFYLLDAYGLAKKIGLGGRINIIMQVAYFALSGVIPREQAMTMIEAAVKDTYGSKGEKVVKMNVEAARQALDYLKEVKVPASATGSIPMTSLDLTGASDFIKNVTAPLIQGQGEVMPVSKMPVDGTFPTATSQYEKRAIAQDVPCWNKDLCIQCAMCSFVCPHAAIRVKVYDAKHDAQAPQGWTPLAAKGKGLEGKQWVVQVAPEDCTGCGVCAYTCPGKAKQQPADSKVEVKALMMTPLVKVRAVEKPKYKHFLAIPDTDLALIDPYTMKGSQLLRPLFEYSGACAGCGETAYIKLMTQLYGDRAVIGNATGCSSIYGGNLPTTPYCQRADGRGPAWANSLFEDNAEFGMGMRLTFDKLADFALTLMDEICSSCCGDLAKSIKEADLSTHQAIEAQRKRIDELKGKLTGSSHPKAKQLLAVIDNLVPRQTWIVGGDGWAYDIGYGGLDHVLASGRNVKALVVDTGVYSNTGGQASKATPRGAVAKFAAAGKNAPRKDLGMMAMSYGNVYVAQIAYGANPMQTIKAFKEAGAYNGPALIIAYSHCIAHGIDMIKGTDLQKEAVKCGFWPLYRFNPALIDSPEGALALDNKAPEGDVGDFMAKQNRFKSLTVANPERAEALLVEARKDVARKWKDLTTLIGQKPAAAPA